MHIRCRVGAALSILLEEVAVIYGGIKGCGDLARCSSCDVAGVCPRALAAVFASWCAFATTAICACAIAPV